MLIGSFLRVSCDRVINLALVMQICVLPKTILVEYGDDKGYIHFGIDSPEAQALMSHFGLSPEVEEFEVQE